MYGIYEILLVTFRKIDKKVLCFSINSRFFMCVGGWVVGWLGGCVVLAFHMRGESTLAHSHILRIPYIPTSFVTGIKCHFNAPLFEYDMKNIF